MTRRINPRRRDAQPGLVAPGSYPALGALCRERSLVLVGGVPEPNRLKRLGRELCADIAWVPTARGKEGTLRGLENQLRAGKVGAAVIFERLMGHHQVESVQHAARAGGVLWAYGGKSGSGDIDRALRELETRLGSARANPAVSRLTVNEYGDYVGHNILAVREAIAMGVKIPMGVYFALEQAREYGTEIHVVFDPHKPHPGQLVVLRSHQTTATNDSRLAALLEPLGFEAHDTSSGLAWMRFV